MDCATESHKFRVGAVDGAAVFQHERRRTSGDVAKLQQSAVLPGAGDESCSATGIFGDSNQPLWIALWYRYFSSIAMRWGRGLTFNRASVQR